MALRRRLPTSLFLHSTQHGGRPKSPLPRLLLPHPPRKVLQETLLPRLHLCRRLLLLRLHRRRLLLRRRFLSPPLLPLLLRYLPRPIPRLGRPSSLPPDPLNSLDQNSCLSLVGLFLYPRLLPQRQNPSEE